MLRRIEEGKLRPGDRVPSESEFMRQYNVSRGTVTRALRDLEVTGVVNRRRGSGTFVRDPGRDADTRGKAMMNGDSPLHLAIFTPWTTTEKEAGAFHIALHHGISRVCSDHRATLTLQCLSSVGETQRERLINATRTLIDRRPKVVLYCGLELPHDEMQLNMEVMDLLSEAGIDIVVIDRDVVPYPERSRFTWVSYDNRRGSALLVSHLHRQGYRRIAFVSIGNDSTAVFERQAGYFDGLRLCGHDLTDDRVVVAGESVDEELADRVLATKPDAVICKDTAYAARLSLLLGRRGLQIGRDIGMAGYDDDPVASMLPVPLTVVRQPIAPFAAAAFRMASLISSEKDHAMVAGSRIVIPTELVLRDSTRRD